MEQHRPGKRGERGAVCKVLALLAAFLLAVSLTGCKYSDVLTELIEDPVNGELDENQEPRYELNPDAELERELTSLIIQDADRIDEQYRDLPVFDSQVPPDDTTDQRENDDDTDNRETASSGNKRSNDDDKNDEAGEEETITDSSAGSGEGTGEGTSDQTVDQEGEGAQDGIAGGGAGGSYLTYDATGVVDELPEARSIAAVGQYATIVQMLAGRGGLAAADAAWVDMVHARGIFPNEEAEGIGDIAIAWTGSHDAGYALDMEALLAASPSVVLVDNADVMLSDDERNRLTSAGIRIVTVPTLGSTDTPDADIVQAVAIVGQMLSSSDSYYDTSAQVTSYNALHDETIANCVSANGGYSYKTIGGGSYAGIYQGTSIAGMDTTNFSATRFTTVFIDSMTYSLNPSAVADRTYGDGLLEYLNGETVDASNGIGLSVQGKSSEFVLLDYYMQVSGVVNNSYDGAKPVISSSGSGLANIIIPGYAQDLIPSALVGAFAVRGTYSALWYMPDTSRWLTVGDVDFPGALARSSDIAQAVVASASKSNGIYNVGQPYFVRVVPTGVAGSWADGTVESFLAAPWTFGAFQQNDVAAACDSYADAFYQTFYRVDDASAIVQDYDTVYWVGG